MDVASATEFQKVRARFSQIYVIVSPPRCCSTAFARVFWRHPTIDFYSHEPFEISYFDKAPKSEVEEKLLAAISVNDDPNQIAEAGEQVLVIKEMPYQVGPHFPFLASLATAPLILIFIAS